MELKAWRTLKRNQSAGFTLIELLVVVLIIGILAAIAVPQYFRIVEKGKVAESMSWIGSLKGTQERYLGKNGIYCTAGAVSACGFDTGLGLLKYFDPTLAAGTGSPSWKVSLVRKTPTPAVYGAYSVIWDSGGAPPLTCDNTDCTNDLLP